MVTGTESIRIENFKNWYEQNQNDYDKTAKYVHAKIMTYIEEQKFNVAHSSARVKSIDSAYNKAKKMVEKDGKYILKYTDPQNQIMDFAGVRIVVYLASEVKNIIEAIEQLFAGGIRYDDSGNKIDLLGEDKVGYLSVHYVVTIDTDEIQYARLKGKKCEIQVRTVLQDAWAQVFHDRLYKASMDNTEEYIKRKTNLLSGSLELIDNQIDEIVKYYDSKNGNLSQKAYQALLNENITEKSLSEYCSQLMNGKVEGYYSYQQVKDLLSALKIKTVRELNYCVNDGFIKKLRNTDIPLTIDRLVRYIMIVHDYKGLLDRIAPSQKFIIAPQTYDLLIQFVDLNGICEQYQNFKIYESEENING